MVFGVALRMFPMPKGAARESRSRYPSGPAAAACVGINLGLALRFVAEPTGNPALGLISGLLQTLGIGWAIAILWPRIHAILPPRPDARVSDRIMY